MFFFQEFSFQLKSQRTDLEDLVSGPQPPVARRSAVLVHFVNDDSTLQTITVASFRFSVCFGRYLKRAHADQMKTKHKKIGLVVMF